MRVEAVETARRIVADRFPEARAAWLGGSVARGSATATSDLDVTVLLDGPPAPYRHSLVVGDWPVELFVHTEASLAHYVAQDLARRQPTMMRLVAESVVLVDRDGSGERLRKEMAVVVEQGPPPLSEPEVAAARYAVTDLIVDLEGVADPAERAAVASLLWQEAAHLLLAGSRAWTGRGKGLVRELRSHDAAHGTTYASELLDGLASVVAGGPRCTAPLVAACDRVLREHGGRLFDGHRLEGEVPEPS